MAARLQGLVSVSSATLLDLICTDLHSIGIRGCRVLENMIFADMPGNSFACSHRCYMLISLGLSDISRVRVKASKNYMRSSDHLWIAVPITRCVSDSGVDSILCEFGDRFKGRLAMICTKIDDSMRSDSFKEQYPHAAKKLDKIERYLKEAQMKGSRQEEQDSANYRLKFMINERNQDVANEIYQTKSEHFEEGDDGPVFFVSNEHYMWLKGYRDSGTVQDLAQLDAAMTGIPALRKYALSIPAQDMWLTFMAHIQHNSTAFLKSTAIWAARTNADHGAELNRIKKKSIKASADISLVALYTNIKSGQ